MTISIYLPTSGASFEPEAIDSTTTGGASQGLACTTRQELARSFARHRRFAATYQFRRKRS
jgi:hypothetical protein